MVGIYRINRERQNQLDKGYTPDHDSHHDANELVAAAISYAFTAMHGNSKTQPDPLWPWGEESWSPSDEPIRNLEKAGALIAAAIDRLET